MLMIMLLTLFPSSRDMYCCFQLLWIMQTQNFTSCFLCWSFFALIRGLKKKRGVKADGLAEVQNEFLFGLKWAQIYNLRIGVDLNNYKNK
ncbi:hypothetical protein L1987_17214 [Smallanthus sonchifolius]|uniref:Uncharacterized protein n=1 Tax=Smallanthus sonchifolius TaxID=185202 RepID=A0ACB9IWW7_9ASTR|nr:hypothetical protein L1987_17214 [Smallanthus sonchifolius]